MSGFQWNKGQQSAIEAKDSTLLVSAAAGSGKTAVLVERILRRLMDKENPGDIRRFLIVTFTRAAAGEMKEKIVSAIYRQMEETPEDRHLARQLALVDTADISTIDAFFMRLVKEHFHLLDISPDVRLADPQEMEVLEEEILAETMEAWYAGPDKEAFQYAVECFADPRSDEKFVEMLRTILKTISTYPDPQGYLARVKEQYRLATKDPVEETPWGARAVAMGQQMAREALAFLEEAEELLSGYEEVLAKPVEITTQERQQLGKLIFSLEHGHWDDAYALCDSLSFARWSAPRSFEDKALLREIKELRDAARALAKEIGEELLFLPQDVVQADAQTLLPVFTTLCDVCLDVMERLAAEKKERAILGFPDLARLAYRLVVQRYNPQTGAVEGSEIAKQLAAQYDAVFIDEYQDTNGVQDAIFSAIDGGEGKLFMVGDIKQSIYRFRQAQPEIFLSRKERFAAYEETGSKAGPFKIELTENFRSRPEILEFANYLFSRLMSVPFAEMEYGAGEALVPGAKQYEETPGHPVEVHLLVEEREDALQEDEETGENVEVPSAVEREAAFTAKKIRRLLDAGTPVLDSDTGTLRPMGAGDIVILMRATKHRAYLYQKALAKEGVAAYSEVTDAFFTKEEVLSVLSLLRAIENPLSDIDLLGALRSPLFSFDAQELALLRSKSPGGAFYEVLCAAEHAGDQKAAQAVKKLETYRRLSLHLPVDALLEKIFLDTGYQSIVKNGAQGAVRSGNLQLLLQYARAFEETSLRGLAAFNTFVEKVRTAGGDIPAAPAVSESADVVRITTVHKAKGLEWPVVFLTDTGRQFAAMDARRPFLLHQQLGFAARTRDLDALVDFETLPRAITAQVIQRENLAEEVRNLYVALTRAKEYLFVVGTLKESKDGLSGIQKVYQNPQGQIYPSLLTKGRSSLAWILSALQFHPCCVPLLEEMGISQCKQDGVEAALFLHRSGEMQDAASAVVETAPKKAVSKELREEIRRRLDFVYPYQAATQTPAKLSVTGLPRLSKEELQEAPVPVGWEDEIHQQIEKQKEKTLPPPAFLQTVRSLTPAQRGTALHHFMQFADLATLATVEGRTGELSRLLRQGYLTPEEGEAVDLAKVRLFTESRLYRRMLEAETLYREHRFTVLTPAADLVKLQVLSLEEGKALSGEELVVQGVMDAAFLEDGEMVVVDFKTDRIRPDQTALFAQRHRDQLMFYGYAVEEMTGYPVKERLLWSMELGQEVSV